MVYSSLTRLSHAPRTPRRFSLITIALSLFFSTPAWPEPFEPLVCDGNFNGIVDFVDIALTFSSLGESSTGVTDPRDADGSGMLNVGDIFVCVQACTRPSCATRGIVARGGNDLRIAVGEQVYLDASATSNFRLGGPELSFTWSIIGAPAGSVATLSSTTDPFPAFVPDVAGEYEFLLTVTHGTALSDTDTVRLSTENTAPQAKAGRDRRVAVGRVLTLDGSASFDIDADRLDYQWVLLRPDASAATLSDPESARPTFTVDVPGNYVAELTVDDGQTAATDRVVVTTMFTPVDVDAGADQASEAGGVVVLDASGVVRSASGDIALEEVAPGLGTLSWSFVSKPPGSAAVIAEPNANPASFVTDVPGDYVVQIAVTPEFFPDGLAIAHAPDTVRVSTNNTRPVADTGSAQAGSVGDLIILNGGLSSDADLDGLSYSWSLTSVPPGSEAMLSDPAAVTSSFIADQAGIYIVQLIVDDGDLGSEPDTLVVSVVEGPSGGDGS